MALQFQGIGGRKKEEEKSSSRLKLGAGPIKIIIILVSYSTQKP